MPDLQTLLADPEPVTTEVISAEETSETPAPSAIVTVHGDVWHGYREQFTALEKTAASVPKTDAKLARATRLSIKAIRCEMENKRKKLVGVLNEQLDEINGKANGIRDAMKATEETLLAIEDAAEREEEARVAKLAGERSEKIQSAGGNPANYASLGTMPEEEFSLTVEGLAAAKAAKAILEAKAEAQAAERAEEEARQKAAAAPDKEKLHAFAEAVRSLPVPELVTEAGKALANELAAQTEKFAQWISKKAATL